jgi:hypothetical protein
MDDRKMWPPALLASLHANALPAAAGVYPRLDDATSTLKWPESVDAQLRRHFQKNRLTLAFG